MQTYNGGPRMQTSYLGSFTQASYTGRMRKPAELMLVPMIDIFTVLVTFLLMTAVFSRITILQLELPSSDTSTAAAPPAFRLEVIVRHEGFELTNGSKLIATIPKANGEYDLKTLSQLALSLKREYPDANDASVLLERDIQYDYLIQVMDAIRSTEETAPADPAVAGQAQADPPGDALTAGVQRPRRVPLFAQIAVGDAP
jgi:biopolymer transport protein ExbD